MQDVTRERSAASDLVVSRAPIPRRGLSARRRGRLVRTTSVALAIALVGGILAARNLGSQPTARKAGPVALGHRLLVEQYRPWGYVAHALGSVRGTVYTNSVEAFEESYRKGFRIYEIDLALLRDGSVVAAHDPLRYGIEDKKLSDLTAKDFEGLRFRGEPGDAPSRLVAPVITDERLVALMKKYPDAYFITDTKGQYGVEILTRLKTMAPRSVMNRFIPHLHGPEHLKRLRALHPFPNYMLALYRTQGSNLFDDDEVVEFVRTNHIPAVMMWWRTRNPKLTLEKNASEHRRFTAEFARRLQSMGVAVYVHSLDRPQDMAPFRSLHVGVYSNGWFPEKE